jgi:TonB family protein
MLVYSGLYRSKELQSMKGIVAFIGLIAIAASVGSQEPLPDKNGTYFARYKVTNPQLDQAVAAAIPSNPKVASLRHVCVLSVVIGTDGTVREVTVENSRSSALDDAAIQAVKQSKFLPGKLHESPVPMRTDVWVRFKGDGTPATPEVVPQKPEHQPIATVYPEASFSDVARRHGTQGEVALNFLVREDGMPTDIRLVSHLPDGLDEEALSAVKQYRFKPAMLDGESIPMRTTIYIGFKLF